MYKSQSKSLKPKRFKPPNTEITSQMNKLTRDMYDAVAEDFWLTKSDAKEPLENNDKWQEHLRIAERL